ncbi:hypothetical protein C2G38_2216153 [Gigaspora rosea]|uniref:Uncharacterized protein n=1 Tax=Gigaspora rosea TaxID=44941 RepID=A0A397U9G5_9GLOM|nr:hypothetical protein C2G38_2216153 [Gigaspora rosea]
MTTPIVTSMTILKTYNKIIPKKKSVNQGMKKKHKTEREEFIHNLAKVTNKIYDGTNDGNSNSSNDNLTTTLIMASMMIPKTYIEIISRKKNISDIKKSQY